jgi:hypothetical protein
MKNLNILRKIFFTLTVATTIHTHGFSQIKVIDQFQLPVPQAQIMIGSELNQPFVGNFLQTDSSGLVARPSDWSAPASITIDAPGFIKQTIYAVAPDSATPGLLTISLRLKHHLAPVYISGQITDLPVVNKDKFVNFSLVTQSFNNHNLKNVSHRSFLSPYADPVRVLGKDFTIFSNASLPTQKETYGIPLTLEKPIYRLFETQKNDSELVTLSGLFPFKTVVDSLLAGKSFNDVINLFDIHSVNNYLTQMDRSQNNVNFSGVKHSLFNSVQYRNISLSSDETSFVVPMNKKNNQYWPVTIKKLGSFESTEFNTLNNDLKILTIIRKTNELENKIAEENLSAVFDRAESMSDYLPLFTGPILNNQNRTLEIKTFPVPNSLNPTGQHIVLSKNYQTEYQSQIIMNQYPVWEIYTDKNPTLINLPRWPLNLDAFDSISWSLFAKNSIVSEQENKTRSIYQKIDDSTHVTKAQTHLVLK